MGSNFFFDHGFKLQKDAELWGLQNIEINLFTDPSIIVV